jgi:hypothetical protein
VAPRVNRFFQTVVIEFTLKCVEADTYVQELMQTLCRLFTVTQKPFYSRYGSKGGEVHDPSLLSHAAAQSPPCKSRITSILLC